MTIKFEQEKTKRLVKKAKEGDPESFRELERLAKPLMVHLSDYYSNLHKKFEYDDFYAICFNALYEACVEYDPANPSFLSYAKTFMVNQCNRELEYWNAEMRNIFDITEILVGLEREIKTREGNFIQLAVVEDEVFRNEFRNNVTEIIDSMFDNDKADILKLYIFSDMRPRDIAQMKESEYHQTYSTIRRGIPKIAKEYKSRYTLDITSSL